MPYLLDTTAFSDLMREHPGMQARLAALSSAEVISICTIVRGEILHGIGRLPEGQRRQDLSTKAARLFAAIPCIPIIEAVGDHYAEIKLDGQRKGLSLDENDLWIAAAARQAGATLVSRDSDFARIEGLSVEDWTKQIGFTATHLKAPKFATAPRNAWARAKRFSQGNRIGTTFQRAT